MSASSVPGWRAWRRPSRLRSRVRASISWRRGTRRRTGQPGAWTWPSCPASRRRQRRSTSWPPGRSIRTHSWAARCRKRSPGYRALLAGAGLDIEGELTDPVAAVPTAIGATRLATVLPAGMAGALAPWQDGERLVVCGPAGFRDFWPEAVAASLRRDAVWRGRSGPSRVDAVSVELPGLAGRRNLSGLDLARAFDDPAWRETALDAMARAIDRAGTDAGSGPGRVALPAVLGLDEHPAVLGAARARLPLRPFEVALVPPSVPGLRLYRALRADPHRPWRPHPGRRGGARHGRARRPGRTPGRSGGRPRLRPVGQVGRARNGWHRRRGSRRLARGHPDRDRARAARRGTGRR